MKRKVKIISGGQTGIDQMALRLAKEYGLETGGTAPKGYMTENGQNLELRNIYGLREDENPGYKHRTYQNVIDSDATLLFGNTSSPGSRQTIQMVIEYGDFMLPNPDSTRVLQLIEQEKIKILNIAGNRETALLPSHKVQAEACMREVFEKIGSKK